MGISAALVEKEISNLVTVRTIKCWVVLPGEALGFLPLEVVKKSLEKHLSGIIQREPYAEAGPMLAVLSSPIFCDSASCQKRCHGPYDFGGKVGKNTTKS